MLAAAAAGLTLMAIVGGRVSEPASEASTPSGESTVVAPSGVREAGSALESSRGLVDDLVPQRGAGTTRALPVPGEDSTRSGRLVRYSVEIEDGLRVDEEEYARTVRTVLTDGRGWETQDGVHFVHVDPMRAGDGTAVDVHITLATPDTVDRLCAPLATEGEVSCQNGNRVILNAVRWTRGVSSYEGQLPRYREYLVNHEVGHALGHGHEACAGPDQPAPVMLQQTLGLDGCTRYPWPVPDQPL